MYVDVRVCTFARVCVMGWKKWKIGAFLIEINRMYYRTVGVSACVRVFVVLVSKAAF